MRRVGAGTKWALWSNSVSMHSLFILIDSGSLETIPCNAKPVQDRKAMNTCANHLHCEHCRRIFLFSWFCLLTSTWNCEEVSDSDFIPDAGLWYILLEHHIICTVAYTLIRQQKGTGPVCEDFWCVFLFISYSQADKMAIHQQETSFSVFLFAKKSKLHNQKNSSYLQCMEKWLQNW